jgi:hypothetical protein
MPQNLRKYRTDRTRELRSKSLSEYEKDLLDKVEKFGCMVLHVKDPHEPRPTFSYTIGCADTRQTPEFITCGLSVEAALQALDHAVDVAAEGIDLLHGRHIEFLGSAVVEFRPVAQKWAKALMLSTCWFHGNSDFVALQLVYPDLEGRFPEDEGFNTFFDQPLLQNNSPMRKIEQDLWDENSPDGKFHNWSFADSPHTSAYLSETVNDGTEEVTYVSHDADDNAWQFLGDSMSDGGGPVIVCLHHPIDKDPSLKELADLPVGWYAEREAPGHPWIRNPKPPEDETS